uniref:Neurotransmitter-gated ion-channel ligand-binding domain-containing protein n=1 Tax=Plectus sambesii TaxID=2011161 RepID=A0A914VN16_9BILA
MDDIFQGYDQRIRPVKNKSSPLTVRVQPTILRLIEVNAQQEYIKLSLSIDQTWNDEFLTWNPAEYNGTNAIMVPKTALWLPDTTVVTTSFEAEEMIDQDKEVLMVQHDGTVSRSYPFVLSNYCPMKTDEFPFDKQECIIKITSWHYPANVVRYEPMYNETTYPQNNNSAWDILPITVEAVDFNVENAGQYRQIWYTLTIKRKSEYYVLVLVMPTLIITALSIAGIFAPINNIGDRQEKITLGLTTLLTLAVILSMVTGEMPRSDNLPVLGRFVLDEIIIIVICMAVSVVILFLHQRATTRPWP